MNKRLEKKLINNPTLPALPTQNQPHNPQTVSQTSLGMLHSLRELIARSNTKGELIKNLAQMNKPIFAVGLALIDGAAYERAHPHLLDLLDAITDDDKAIEALQGVIDA